MIIDRASSAGAVAQLGERLVRNEEVRGSNPLGSTIPADKRLKTKRICNRWFCLPHRVPHHMQTLLEAR